MHGNTLVAVYGSRTQAERARDSLLQVGVPQDEIRLSDEGPAPSRTSQVGSERREGLWDWLFRSDVPESDRTWYQTNLSEGRTAVSVLVRNEADRERLIDTLDESGPIDFEGTEQGVTPDLGAGRAAAGAQTTREGEQVIPVVKEELDVGKRATERTYRVHAYVVEKPVEEKVNLRDERVIVERRPATGEQRSAARTRLRSANSRSSSGMKSPSSASGRARPKTWWSARRRTSAPKTSGTLCGRRRSTSTRSRGRGRFRPTASLDRFLRGGASFVADAAATFAS